jgi:hypothetical protein
MRQIPLNRASAEPRNDRLAFAGFNSFQGNKCIDCGGSAGEITSLQFGTAMRELQFAVRLTF